MGRRHAYASVVVQYACLIVSQQAMESISALIFFSLRLLLIFTAFPEMLESQDTWWPLITRRASNLQQPTERPLN